MDVAEHKSTLKNYHDAHYPHFSFIHKTGKAFPKGGFVFIVNLFNKPRLPRSTIT